MSAKEKRVLSVVWYEYYYFTFNDLSFYFGLDHQCKKFYYLERKFTKERKVIRSLDMSLTVLIVAYNTNVWLKTLQGVKRLPFSSDSSLCV